MRKKGEARHNPRDLGKVVLMAEADGYVMIRRPGRMPMCLSSKDWDKWRPYDPARDPRA